MNSLETNILVCPHCKVDFVVANAYIEPKSYALSGLTGLKVQINSCELENYELKCRNCSENFNLILKIDGCFYMSYPYEYLIAGDDVIKFSNYMLAQLNGYISYTLLETASCSVVGNLAANEFANFISPFINNGKNLLDIGCGPQSLPSYIPSHIETMNLFGLDPIKSEFIGNFIKGTAESIPLKSESMDYIICATSLDHFFDLRKSLMEIIRVLKKGGYIFIWDHVQSEKKFIDFSLLKSSIKKILSIFYREKRIFKIIFIYENGVVLRNPPGYSDPFHNSLSKSSKWNQIWRNVLSHNNIMEILENKEKGFSIWVKN